MQHYRSLVAEPTTALLFVSLRSLSTYSRLDSLRTFASRKQNASRRTVTESRSSGSGIRRRAQSPRSLQSSTEDRRDAQHIFPTTLHSGRPAQHNTISQQLYYQHLSRRDAAYEVSLQAQRDREYEASLQRAQHGRGVADRRFFKHVNTTDYTEIKDPDPYADIFGESGGTQRLRTAAWQRQFEAENAHVELPYERTNVLSRLAPNWFVRFFVNMRDCGGATDATGLVVVAVIALSLMWWVTWMFYTAPSRSRPTHEIR